MNISLLRNLLVLIALSLAPKLCSAQFYEFLEVPLNDTLFYDFESVAGPGQVVSPPSNGQTFIYNTSSISEYVLSYIPNPDFTGRDTLTLRYRVGTVGSLTRDRIIEIEVLPSFVRANEDFAVVQPDSTVRIAVLTNDQGTATPYFSNISLVNDGVATWDANTEELIFTPNAGFEGLTHLNYTVCVDQHTCDVGIVTIFVEQLTSTIDTIRLATKRETPLTLNLPLQDGYQEVVIPSNGVTNVLSAGAIEYIPNTGFFNASDTFTYAYFTNQSYTSLATFIVEVLDTDVTSNLGIANDDHVFVTIDGSVDIEVLKNDRQILNPILDRIIDSTDHGVLVKNGDIITYTPNLGFTGLDKFTYKACLANGPGCENADVIITVDNLYPSATTFELTTVKNSPLVINYNVPIEGFNFVNVPELSTQDGFVEYYNTFDDLVNGQRVQGEEVILYFPPTDFVGIDEFEFEYCPLSGACRTVKAEIEVIDIGNPNDTFCIAECVWAGDANDDGTVDIKDLLPVGYSTGITGPARSASTLDWYGQFAEDWNQSTTALAIDLKHVDTDGDGLVQSDDTLAISMSYGRTHNLTASSGPVLSDLPLFFVPQTQGPYLPGDVVVIEVLLGTQSVPAIDINGLTFTMNYNNTIVEPGSFDIQFDRSSWLGYNSPMLDMIKYPFLGRAEAGITRTSSFSASGLGKIATVDFIIADDLDGVKQFNGERIRKVRLDIESPIIMNGAGQYELLPTMDVEIELLNPDVDPIELSDNDLILFPNPATEVMTVYVNRRNEIREFSIFNLAGQQIFNSGRIQNKEAQLDITSFQNGLYILTAITEKGIVSKKFEVMKP